MPFGFGHSSRPAAPPGARAPASQSLGGHGPPLILRPASEADAEFVARLYGDSRLGCEHADEAGAGQRESATFAGANQDLHFRERHPDARFDVLEIDGEPIGRFGVARGATEFVIVDITLLPEYRGRGIGNELLGLLQDEAGATSTPILLHLGKDNPARSLYRRLGFVALDDAGPHIVMRWSPPAKGGSR